MASTGMAIIRHPFGSDTAIDLMALHGAVARQRDNRQQQREQEGQQSASCALC
ncbi:hypothetical protein [Halomonas tibetensis]|uniref:Uncharacterized protein n=1 Tax=Halomonas tibetensis TaxID=2259590 RepID=A0ABV7B271_9GAMM